MIGSSEHRTPQQPRRLPGRNPSRSGHVTHHSDSVSNGFGRQVAAELCSHHPAASVCPGHLPPDHTGLVGLPAGRHRVLLGLVDVGAAFAEVEVDLVPAVAALELQQRRVLALVPQAALVARKDGLTPQSERETASDHVTTTSC